MIFTRKECQLIVSTFGLPLNSFCILLIDEAEVAVEIVYLIGEVAGGLVLVIVNETDPGPETGTDGHAPEREDGLVPGTEEDPAPGKGGDLVPGKGEDPVLETGSPPLLLLLLLLLLLVEGQSHCPQIVGG